MPLPIQYADFAYGERRWRSYPDVVAQLTYWEAQLHDPLPVMKLTRAVGNGQSMNSASAAAGGVAGQAVGGRRTNFSQREGVTLFTTLMAALKTLLNVTQVWTIACGHGRRQSQSSPDRRAYRSARQHGRLLRTSLRGDPSRREVIRRVRATILGALAIQDIPFDAVVATLERERGLEPASLAQIMFWLHNDKLRPIVTSGHGIMFEELDPSMLLPLATITTFDVTLMLRESTQGLVGTCVYKPHLFGTKTIDRLLRDFQQVLEQMMMQPERPISAISASLPV